MAYLLAKFKTYIKPIFTFLIFSLLIWWVGAQNIINVIQSVQLQLFIIAVVLVFSGIVVSATRWMILLQSKGNSAPFSIVFPIYYYGAFANLALPSSFGGDVVKGHLMSKNVNESVDSYSSIFINRYIGFVIITCMALFSALVNLYIFNIYVPSFIYYLLLIMFVAVTTSIITLFSSRFRMAISENILTNPFIETLPYDIASKFDDFYKSSQEFKSKPLTLLYVSALSLIFNLISVLTIFIVSLSLGYQLSILYLFMSVPIITLILVVPITIHGYGVREALYVIFYTPVGLTSAESVGFSITVSITIFVTYLGGSFFVVFIE